MQRSLSTDEFRRSDFSWWPSQIWCPSKESVDSVRCWEATQRWWSGNAGGKLTDIFLKGHEWWFLLSVNQTGGWQTRANTEHGSWCVWHANRTNREHIKATLMSLIWAHVSDALMHVTGPASTRGVQFHQWKPWMDRDASVSFLIHT